MGFMELLGALLRGGGSKGGLGDAIGGLLGGDSPIGGLGGLLSRLQEHGLGDVGASWVSKGKNLSISPQQIEAVLGNEQVRAVAAKLGVEPEKAAAQLARYLPQMVDRATPEGKVPDPDTLQRATGGQPGR